METKETTRIAETATTRIPSSDSLMIERGEVTPIATLGSGYKITSREFINLTESVIMAHLNLKELPTERPLSDGWVKKLLCEMLQGTFHPEMVQLAVATLDGVDYRVNGQHCCWAVSEFLTHPDHTEFAKAYLRKPYVVEMIRYKVRSIDELRALYASFDRAKGKTRSRVIQTYLFDMPGFKGITAGTINLLGAAVTPWKRSFNQADQMTEAEVIFLLRTEMLHLAVEVANFLSIKVKESGHATAKEIKHLTRSPVVAAMYSTFSVSTKASEEFWKAVRDGADLPFGDPRLKLRNHLMKTTVTRTAKLDVAEEMLRTCIVCWNLWRDGKKIITAKIPIPFKDRPKAH